MHTFYLNFKKMDNMQQIPNMRDYPSHNDEEIVRNVFSDGPLTTSSQTRSFYDKISPMIAPIIGFVILNFKPFEDLMEKYIQIPSGLLLVVKTVIFAIIVIISSYFLA